MPRAEEMTWEGEPNYRWSRTYKGTRYRITCKEMGCTAWTKEASRPAANDWWRKKRAEIDGVQDVEPGSPQAKIQVLEDFIGRPITSKNDASLALAQFVETYAGGNIPPDMLQMAMGQTKLEAIEKTVKALIQPPETPKEKTIGYQAERWWMTEQDRVRERKLTDSRATMNRTCLNHFKDWIGATSSVEAINEDKWEDFYSFLVNQERWESDYCDRIMGTAKRFVTYLWEKRKIELPRNLDKFAFESEKGEIEIFTDKELQALNRVIEGQSRLHFLLMLNCAFLAKDINDLRHEEVNWTEGTITRKRSKGKRKMNVPTVTYKLWDETFALLKQWRSKDAEIVLLTNTGKRWIIEHKGEVGNWHRSDSVSSCLRNTYMKRAGVKHAPSCLRATAASKLGSHPIYRTYAQEFLGHAPKTVAETYYVKPTREQLFDALAWLKTALGV